MDQRQNPQNSFLGLMNSLNPIGRAALLSYLGYDTLQNQARPVDSLLPPQPTQPYIPLEQPMTDEQMQYELLLQQRAPSVDQYYDMITNPYFFY